MRYGYTLDEDGNPIIEVKDPNIVGSDENEWLSYITPPPLLTAAIEKSFPWLLGAAFVAGLYWLSTPPPPRRRRRR